MIQIIPAYICLYLQENAANQHDKAHFTTDDPDNDSYKYLDVYRTCAVKYTGILDSNTLVGWIPFDHTQTAEWYTSST